MLYVLIAVSIKNIRFKYIEVIDQIISYKINLISRLERN